MVRPNAQARGYGSRWQKARRTFLHRHHQCVKCGEVATVVDHITPHKGSQSLFWNSSNWQALCESCHNSTKKKEEAKGYSDAVGMDGWPTDPRHPANARQ